MMKKVKSRHVGSRLLSILLALVLVLTNFGGTFPGKAKADGEGDEGKYIVTTKGVINHNKDESGATEDVESDAVITAGAGYYGAGDKVTLTVDGKYEALPYLIDRVFYNDGTTDYEVTKDADGKYSFTMPECNVTVTAHVIEFTEWTHSHYTPTRGNYYLSSGVTVDPAESLTVPYRNLNLHLHGNTIEILKEDINKQSFFIDRYSTLSLFDDETSDPSKGGKIVFNGTAEVEGTLNMYGGTICYSGTSFYWKFDVIGELHLINGTIDLNGNILSFAKGGRGYLVGGRVINAVIEAANIVLSGTILENAEICVLGQETINIAGKLPTDVKYVICYYIVSHAFTNGLKGHGDASNFVSDMPQYYEVVLNDEGEAVMIHKRAEISVQANLVGREWTEEDKFTFTLAKADDPEKVIDEVTIGKDSENHAASFKISIEDEGEYSYVISQKNNGQTIDKLTYDAEDKKVTISAERDPNGFVYTTSGSTLTPTVTFTNTYGYKVTTKGIVNQNTGDVESDAVITAGAGYYGAGDKVILTVDSKYEEAPDNSTSYYLIDRMFYNDGTADHEITKDADGKYSFTMPESNVTVTAHVIQFDPWDSSTSLPTGGNYYLTEGVSVDEWHLDNYANLNLHLNSQKVEVGYSINIDHATLNLFDNEAGGSTGSGEIEANTIWLEYGTLNVYGGIIDSSNASIYSGQLRLINGQIKTRTLSVADDGKIDLAGGSVTDSLILVESSEYGNSEIMLSGTISTNTTIWLGENDVINIAGKLPTDVKYAVGAEKYPHVITSGLQGNGDVTNFINKSGKYEVVLNENGEAEIISKRAEISVQANLEGREWTSTDKFTFTLAKADDSKKVIDEVTIGKDSENHTASFKKISFEDAGTYSYVISQETKGQTIDKLTYDAEEKTVTITVEKLSDGTIVAASDSSLTQSVSFTNTYGYKVTTKGIINQEFASGIKDVESNAVITAGAGFYESGQTVTLTINNDYKQLPHWLIDRVFYNDGTADHEITKNADGEYSFTMPESNVTVTAHVIKFKEWLLVNSLPTNGNYFLDCNVDTTWCDIPRDLNVLLNGKSATISDFNGEPFRINETLSLYDGETGASTTGGQLTIKRYTKLCGTINMYGGTLSFDMAHADIVGGRFNLFNGTINLNGMHLSANEKGSINLVGGCVKDGQIIASNSVITLSGTTFEDASIDLKGTGIINIAGKLPTGAEYKVSADKFPYVLTKGLKGNGDASNFIPADSNYVVYLNADGEAVLDYDRTKYHLYVGGIQVTEGNCNKSSNHWSYDFENHVLTLNNYEFVGQGYAYDMVNGGKKGAVIYYDGEEDLTINLVGKNVITPDGTNYNDCGILSVNANATLNFTGDGSLFIESTGKAFAYYDTAINAAGSIVVNSSGPFYAGNNDPNYGISVGLGKTVTIGTNVKQFQAKGYMQGISGTVKNEVKGTGYDRFNRLFRLEIDTEGRALNDYKKVTFPVGDYKLVFVPGKKDKPMGTGSMEEQEVFEGQTFTFPECEFTAPEGMGFAWWEMSGVDILGMPGTEVVIANVCASGGTVYVMVNWGEMQPSEITTHPELKAFKFNGKAQELVTAGSASGGKMNYALGEDEKTAPTTGWQEDVPEATFGGTYYVWYKVKGDSLHYDTEPKCIVVTLMHAAISASVEDQSAEYNGSEHKGSSEVTFTGLLDGHTAEIDYTPASGTLVGVYTGMFDKKSLKVVDAESNDMTDGYVLKSATPGKMTVMDRATKYQINVTANSFVGPYDGEKHTVSGYKKEYTYDGNTYTVEGITASGASCKFVGIAYNVLSGTPVVRDAAGNDVTAQFDVSLPSGAVEIVKRNLVLEITSGSKSFDYDGQKHFYNKYTVFEKPDYEDEGTEGKTEFDLYGNDKLKITPTAKGVTNVGSCENTFTYQIDNADQYNLNVTCNYGTISVDPWKVTIAASDDEKTYDGTALTKDGFGTSGLKTGDTHIFAVTMTADSTITDCGTQANVIGTVDGVAVTTGVETAVGNYLITTVDGKLSIDPAPLTITAQSKELTYDGTAQGWSGYDVVGLFGADAITAVTSGTITFPSEGSVANKIDSYEFTTGKAGNYSVTKVDGVLTMKKASNAITITAADGEWTYDGKAHSNASVTVTSGTLFDGDELVATAGGSVTNVRDNKPGNNPVAEYKIMHGTEDVTANYVVTCVAGTLTLTTTPVVITAQSKELVYDGTAQGWAGYDVEGLIGTDAITAVTSGAITFPSEGTVTNKIDSYEFTSGDARNYTVRTVDGALTMANAAREITITAADGEWTYDGTAHGNGGVTLTGGSLFPGDALVASANGSVKGVADTMQGNNPVAAGYKIMHGTQDVTANYVITTMAGTLTVNPKALYVMADEKTRFHGHADPELTYEVTGLVDGDKISGELTREDGEATGNYKILQGSLTAGDNYTIIFTGATFAIMPNVLYTQSLAEQLWNAIAAGGKQTVYWSEGDSLPFNIMKILQDHPQITLVFSYSYKGVNYRVTIPGSVAKAYSNIPWYGPLYLYGNYGMYNEDGSVKDGAVNPGVPGGVVDGTLRTYVIRRGDTLSRIARRLGTTVRRFVDLNHIKNPNRIYAGHELIYEAQE